MTLILCASRRGGRCGTAGRRHRLRWHTRGVFPCHRRGHSPPRPRPAGKAANLECFFARPPLKSEKNIPTSIDVYACHILPSPPQLSLLPLLQAVHPSSLAGDGKKSEKSLASSSLREGGMAHAGVSRLLPASGPVTSASSSSARRAFASFPPALSVAVRRWAWAHLSLPLPPSRQRVCGDNECEDQLSMRNHRSRLNCKLAR